MMIPDMIGGYSSQENIDFMMQMAQVYANFN